MFTQDKQEEIDINLQQLEKEKENYRGSSWGKTKMKRVFEFLRPYSDYENGEFTVLDLGCGGMTMGRELEKISTFRVIGLDIVFELLRDLSKKRAPAIPLVNGDGEMAPFRENAFDLIVHNQVLHHFFVRNLILSEIKRILKPGGLLLSIETNGWNPYVYYWHKAKKKDANFFVSNNETPFGLMAYKKELKNVGFKIVKTKMVNFDFVKALSPFDGLFSAIPIFNLVFGGSMLVCAQKV